MNEKSTERTLIFLAIGAMLVLVACKSTTPTPSSNQPPPVQYEQGPQARSTPNTLFTPGVPVAPIQHSPWTTTTNDPTVTLQAQQPVSITTTSAISLFAPSLIAWTNAVNGLINPHSPPFYARGDGSSDDTSALQAAINSAAAQKSGVYLPPGTYVSGRLTMTPGIKEFSAIAVIGSKRSIQFSSTVRLKDNSNTNLIYVPPNSYCDLKGICFDGNRTNQTVAASLIYVDVEGVVPGIRNEMRVWGCAINNSKGDGITINRPEVYLHQSFFTMNDGDGVAFKDGATDSVLDYVGSGFNGGSGYSYTGNTGAARAIDFDAWDNHGWGLLIDGDTAAHGDSRFLVGQFNNNFKDGILVTNIVARVVFDSVIVRDSNYQDDSLGGLNPAPSGTYSNIRLEGTNYTTDLVFNNCVIGVGQGLATKYPEYNFKDNRSGTYSGGVGIQIGPGVLARGGTTTGSSIYPPTFGTNAMNLALDTSSRGYDTSLASGNLYIGGTSIIMDNHLPSTNGWFGTTTIYQAEPGGFAVQVNPTNGAPSKFFTVHTNGWVSLPTGTLSTGGTITNLGDLFNNGPITFTGFGSTELYQAESGGFALQTATDTAYNKFWTFHTNGWTHLAGTLSTEGSLTNNGNLLNNGDIYMFGTGTTHLYQLANGGLGIVTFENGTPAYSGVSSNGTIFGNFVSTGSVLFGTNILSVSGTNLMFNGGTVNVTY